MLSPLVSQVLRSGERHRRVSYSRAATFNGKSGHPDTVESCGHSRERAVDESTTPGRQSLEPAAPAVVRSRLRLHPATDADGKAVEETRAGIRLRGRLRSSSLCQAGL